MSPKSIVVKQDGEQVTFENSVAERVGDKICIYQVDEEGIERKLVAEFDRYFVRDWYYLPEGSG